MPGVLYFQLCVCYLALLYSFYHAVSAAGQGLYLVFGFVPLHLHNVLSVIGHHSYLFQPKDLYKCPTINTNEILKNFKVEGLPCIKRKFLKQEVSKERLFTGRFQRGYSPCAGNGVSRGCFIAQ